MKNTLIFDLSNSQDARHLGALLANLQYNCVQFTMSQDGNNVLIHIK